jgi:dihydropteroate synthase
LNGAGIIRVHDVKEHHDLLRLLKFLKKGTY